MKKRKEFHENLTSVLIMQYLPFILKKFYKMFWNCHSVLSLPGLSICYAYGLGTEREPWLSSKHPGRWDLDCKTQILSVTVMRVNDVQAEPCIALYLGNCS